jgi:hypothetical protein
LPYKCIWGQILYFLVPEATYFYWTNTHIFKSFLLLSSFTSFHPFSFFYSRYWRLMFSGMRIWGPWFESLASQPVSSHCHSSLEKPVGSELEVPVSPFESQKFKIENNIVASPLNVGSILINPSWAAHKYWVTTPDLQR